MTENSTQSLMSETNATDRGPYGATTTNESITRSVIVDVEDANCLPRGRASRLRLKKSVQNLMNARKFTGHYQAKIVADPGVDVEVAHPQLEADFKADVLITAADYSSSRVEIKNLTNADFGAYLKRERPSWAAVRWINIQGMDYQTIKQVARRFALHPLAVEDVFHIPTRIKSDWYENHLYVSMHLVAINDVNAPQAQLFPRRPEISFTSGFKQMQIDRPNITMEQANFFLTRDGTIISIFQVEGQKVTEPIFSRLHVEGTKLRDSEDASFLLFTLIDAVSVLWKLVSQIRTEKAHGVTYLLQTVDHSFPVVTAYQNVLEELEERVFVEPKAEYTQELHLVAKEVSVLKRMLAPTQYLVQTLRENAKVIPKKDAKDAKLEMDLISDLTKTYLRDVSVSAHGIRKGLPYPGFLTGYSFLRTTLTRSWKIWAGTGMTPGT
ncbi:hypothetical protein HK097_006291 [Rhizophlyctis rosea]|uniref:Uncharacterized protein n=1 Tax=Rhizophlyctis rosea TaxID=64517 RepID=A0AAD5SG07_9FUNG|nr:hypothetical protein HK097_006291 [Rhizophlyctis rosea]